MNINICAVYTYIIKCLDFPFSYVQTQHTTVTSFFIHRDVEDSSFVITTSVVTKLIGKFGNLWPVCTKDMTPPSKKNLIRNLTHPKHSF